jgi:hypothetical protein
MTGELEFDIRESYQVLAMALELLADITGDDMSLLYIDCARRSAGRLYLSALSSMVSPELNPE